MKTNAARVLDRMGIAYRMLAYAADDDPPATTVAARIGLPAAQVYKTLVVRGDRTGPMLAVVPADAELDLGALARASGDRRAELVSLPEVQPITGYVRGGVTALATRRPLAVYLDSSAPLHPEIAVSAGLRGTQLVLAPDDYVSATAATVAPLTRSGARRAPGTAAESP